MNNVSNGHSPTDFHKMQKDLSETIKDGARHTQRIRRVADELNEFNKTAREYIAAMMNNMGMKKP